MSPKNPPALMRIIGGIVAIALAVVLFLFFRDREGPSTTLAPSTGAVSPETEFSLAMADDSGVSAVHVVAVQGGASVPVLNEQIQGEPKQHTQTFRLPPGVLRDGALTLEISVHDGSMYNFGSGAQTQIAVPLTIDTIPPTISIDSPTNNVTRGGAGIITFTSNEDLGKAGVFVGETYFPGYRLPDGRFACLFTFPYFVEKADFAPKLYVEDIAGNKTLRGFPFHANDKQFRQDRINISDNFLEMKMPEFRRYFPNTSDPKDVFLKVNNELRVQNRALLRELGMRSAPEPLWKGDFLRMRNTAPMASFGDRRSYMYNGQKIDEQTHLGVDLASVTHDDVPAANDGVVAFTGEVGIYGLCVVIDHGLGLQTLYAHLSRIVAKEGDPVKRGQLIGISGMTGMAGGDHLHYGMTVSGIPVTPVEWWDGSWIKNNITSKLNVK